MWALSGKLLVRFPGHVGFTGLSRAHMGTGLSPSRHPPMPQVGVLGLTEAKPAQPVVNPNSDSCINLRIIPITDCIPGSHLPSRVQALRGEYCYIPFSMFVPDIPNYFPILQFSNSPIYI